MKRAGLVLGTLVAALAAWFYFSPRLAVKHLRDAARTGDVEALPPLVDFALVREQFKADLKTSLLQSTSKRDVTTPSGTAHAACLGGRMVLGLSILVASPYSVA